MQHFRETFLRAVTEALLRDHARPIELLSLVMLSGWAQFLLVSPETFKLPRYAAFAGLEPATWASLILAVIAAQLVALWPSRYAAWIRLVAMAFAAGLWAVIAVNFWEGDTPIAARTFTVLAGAAVITTAYLGVVARLR